MEAEDLGGAAGAVNNPIRLLENGEDVLALHGFTRLAHRTRRVMATIMQAIRRMRERNGCFDTSPGEDALPLIPGPLRRGEMRKRRGGRRRRQEVGGDVEHGAG